MIVQISSFSNFFRRSSRFDSALRISRNDVSNRSSARLKPPHVLRRIESSGKSSFTQLACHEMPYVCVLRVLQLPYRRNGFTPSKRMNACFRFGVYSALHSLQLAFGTYFYWSCIHHFS